MEFVEDHSSTAAVAIEEFPAIIKTSAFFLQYKVDSEPFVYNNSSTLNAYDDSSLKTLSSKSLWSAEEDFRLRSAVRDARDGAYINWESVMLQMPGRSAQELLARFSILESSKDAWTEEEDQQLLDLIDKHGKNSWPEISLELGGNRRTPFQCLQRYQKELRSDRLFTLPWNKDEDALLKLGIERYGYRNFQAIASHIPGRTADQCRNRVRKSVDVHEHLVSGRWTEDEQRHLFLAALAYNIAPLSALKRSAEDLNALLDGRLDPSLISDKFGPESRWAAASKLVPGKNDVYCREKWSNNLDPTISFAAYTDEEDEILDKLIAIFGEKSWTKIASFMPGRTDYTVRRRWMQKQGISPLLRHRKEDGFGVSSRKQKPQKKTAKRKASDSDEDSEEDEIDEDYMDDS